MITLFIKYGQRLPSEAGEVIKDIVVAAYLPDALARVSDADHPGCVRRPYPGALDDLPRFGPPPPHGTFDMRPRLAPTVIDLSAYASQQRDAMLVHGAVFNVAADGEAAVPVLCDGTANTIADLAMLRRFGEDAPTGTRAWTDNDKVTTVLTGAQLVRLEQRVSAWVSASYPALAAIQADVQAGTITTIAEVDERLSAITA